MCKDTTLFPEFGKEKDFSFENTFLADSSMEVV